MRKVALPAVSSAKGISKPKGTFGSLAGERGQRTDIDTAEMGYIHAQHDLVRASAEAMEPE
jgi:hypothetical protein